MFYFVDGIKCVITSFWFCCEMRGIYTDNCLGYSRSPEMPSYYGSAALHSADLLGGLQTVGSSEDQTHSYLPRQKVQSAREVDSEQR
jgi:hypothetical protein